MSREALNEAFLDLLENLKHWYETEKLMLENEPAENLTREDYHETLFQGRWYSDPHRAAAVSAREAGKQRKLDRDFELTNWIQHD